MPQSEMYEKRVEEYDDPIHLDNSIDLYRMKQIESIVSNKFGEKPNSMNKQNDSIPLNVPHPLLSVIGTIVNGDTPVIGSNAQEHSLPNALANIPNDI